MNFVLIKVDLQKLLQLDNVISNPRWEGWTGGPITLEEISKYTKYYWQLYSPDPYNPDIPEDRQSHLKRIAYYILHGWNYSPIYIQKHYDDDYILDGIHRVIAAYFRKDPWIIAKVENNPNLIQYLTY